MLLSGVLLTGCFNKLDPSLNYDANIPYSETVNIPDLEKFHPKLQVLIQRITNEEKDRFLSSTEHLEKLKKGEKPWDIKINTAIEYETEKVVSLILSVSTYSNAVSDYYFRTINYDLSVPGKMKLEHVFEASILKMLSNRSRKQFADIALDVDRLRGGTEPNWNNFQYWNISENGLTFRFPRNKIGPSSLGIQQMKIGLKGLRPHLTEYGKTIWDLSSGE